MPPTKQEIKRQEAHLWKVIKDVKKCRPDDPLLNGPNGKPDGGEDWVKHRLGEFIDEYAERKAEAEAEREEERQEMIDDGVDPEDPEQVREWRIEQDEN